jgi:hypothetical protein
MPRVSTLPSLIQYSTGIPSQTNKARERNEIDSNREGRSQIISIFKWYDCILKKSYRFHQKNLIVLINTFRNVAGYKINIEKSVAFLYISNEQAEKEIRKTISLIIVSKKKKPMCKPNQGRERPQQWKLQNLEERNWRRHLKKERLPVFMDWQN